MNSTAIPLRSCKAEPLAAAREADLAAAFRGAMRRLSSGVTVVVASGREGAAGMAATSLTSLAMAPPSLLVCVNRQASLHACLGPGAKFGVNLLSRAQHDVAVAFGGAVAGPLRFKVGTWSADMNGLPQLEGAQANIACAVDRIIAYGTHSIVIGRVEAVRLGGAVAPLIYQDGSYL